MSTDELLLTLTDTAKQRILELLSARQEEDLVVRLKIVGRRSTRFEYEFGVMYRRDVTDDYLCFDLGELELCVDKASIPLLQGSTLDFRGLGQGGFKIDNPNPVWEDPQARQVAELIDAQINPAIAAHGGYITLVDLKDGAAYIHMGGGCQGCGMAAVTLRQGVEKMIREAIPTIREIVDVTAHAEGTRPYYASPASGESPLAKN